ncbi:MAG: hypothetical protein V7767_14520, partial [Leeuwenhoekiella sp.]
MNKIYAPNLLILLCFICLSPLDIFAQVGIGNKALHASAILDIGTDNSNKGILIPRVNITDINSSSPITGIIAESLLVYNTNINTGKGFYFWSQNVWKRLLVEEDNYTLYSSSSSLNGNRIVNQKNNSLTFLGNAGKNQLSLKRTTNNLQYGLSFKNSDNTYAAAIYLEKSSASSFVLATGGSSTLVTDLTPTLTLKDDNSLVLNQYGQSKFLSYSPYGFLTINSTGDIGQIDLNTAFKNSNLDWFEEGKTPEGAADDINDNIYTYGRVGININLPAATLHIYESTGTKESAGDGSVIIQHGDNGGQSSILFKSAVKEGSDFAFIK